MIMKQTIYDEKTGLWYELQGEYYFPCVTVPEGTDRPVGIWGRRHLSYLKRYKKSVYREFLRSGRLCSYLREIDCLAENMVDSIMEDLATREGITEALKAQNQMKWVQRMNAIRQRAEEIVRSDLICML